MTPEILKGRFDYWTFHLGPKFSKRERQAMNLHCFHAVCQVEYCLNFIFCKAFPIHKLFERLCGLRLLELTTDKISWTFGQRLTKQLQGNLHTLLQCFGLSPQAYRLNQLPYDLRKTKAHGLIE